MLGETYVRGVLAMAPLVVCLAWSCEPDRVPRALPWLCAASFGLSLFLSPLQVWGALPWLALSLWQAGAVSRTAYRDDGRDLATLANLAAHLYLPVGGIWALFHELKVQPLGFAAVIVLLTGVHFHYAGFALPWLTGRLLAARPAGPISKTCAAGVIAGVPLVAIGITSSQLSLPPAIEVFAVTILACSALGISHGYLAWAGEVEQAPKVCFLLGGLALGCGMVLALLYGWRSLVPISWVTIPAMYTLHGTLNSWGFCLPCILGNRLLQGGGEGPRRKATP